VQTKPSKLPDESDDLKDHKSIVESLKSTANAVPSPTSEAEPRTNHPQQSSHSQQPDIIPSSSQQFHALASLVNVAAQHGSDQTTNRVADYQSSTKMNGASAIRPQDDSIVRTTTVVANDEHDTHPSQSIATITYPDGTLTSTLPAVSLSSLPKQNVQATDDMEPFLTLGDTTATSTSGSLYVSETKTLMPGGQAVAFSGTPVSLASDATAVVVGSSTSSLTASRRIGGYVSAGVASMLSVVKDDTISAPGTTGEITAGASDNSGDAVSRSSTTITSTENDGQVVTAIILIAETASLSQSNLLSASGEEVTDEANYSPDIFSPTSTTVISTA
jgi:hypothetical protein